MSKTHDRFTVFHSDPATDTAAHREGRTSSRLAALLAVILVIALGMQAWLIVSTGVSDVSAAAADTRPASQVPYFPSQYVNQATEIEPAPATF